VYMLTLVEVHNFDGCETDNLGVRVRYRLAPIQLLPLRHFTGGFMPLRRPAVNELERLQALRLSVTG